MGSIIDNGQSIPCSAHVVGWRDSGLHFAKRRTRLNTRAIVWHWTGGYGDARDVFNTLQARRPWPLSVNFIIDKLGTIYQCCDALAVCAHAGGREATMSANPWAPGVEVCGRARTRGGAGTWWTPAQMTAARALMQALCSRYNLPAKAPQDDAGEVIAKPLTRDQLAQWHGQLGHYHITPTKRDPGSAWLTELCRVG